MLRKKIQTEAKPPVETSCATSESKVEQDAPEAKTGEKRPGEEATEAKSGGGIRLVGAIGGQEVRKPVADSKRIKPAELRIQKDMAELDSGSAGTVTFPNPNDLTRFDLQVAPDSGHWQGARFQFTVTISDNYPHEAPKVHCNTKIYHPNIDLEGHVCLNILRKDWKPVLDINAVIYGIIYLFYDPNPDDPLNKEAAQLFRDDTAQFSRVVKRTLQGQSHNGESFPRLI